MPLKFSALKDTGCEGLSPSGATELGVGDEESFTCSHTLAVGSYSNEASIEGNEGTGTKTSNKVVAKVNAEPSYTIEKLQKIAGEGTFSNKRSDRQTRPDGRIQGRRQEHRQRGAQIQRPQRHRLRRPLPLRRDRTRRRRRRVLHVHATNSAAVGSYTNEASIEGNEGTGTKTSNKVIAKVNAEPAFTIEKQQRINGEGTFGTGEASGKIGQTVEYKINVKNTGNVTLKFGALTDAGCDRDHAARRDRTESRRRRDLHLHAHAFGGRQLQQRSLDRRQRRHRQKDVQQSHRQSPGRTVLHHREAAADRRRRHLHLRRTHRQSRPGRRIQDHRPQHRQRGAEIRRHERHRLHRPRPVGHDRTPPRAAEEFFTCTHTLTAVGSYTNEASIEGNEGTGTKTSNKATTKVPPNRPSRSQRNRRSKAKPATPAPKRPAKPARRSNTRSSSRTPAT